MKKGLVIKTYGDPEITGAIVAALVPAEQVSVARELHEYLYGVCGGRTPGYYAACIKSARRMYGDNPETTLPERVMWGVIGVACLIGAAFARGFERLNGWVLGV